MRHPNRMLTRSALVNEKSDIEPALDSGVMKISQGQAQHTSQVPTGPAFNAAPAQANTSDLPSANKPKPNPAPIAQQATVSGRRPPTNPAKLQVRDEPNTPTAPVKAPAAVPKKPIKDCFKPSTHIFVDVFINDTDKISVKCKTTDKMDIVKKKIEANAMLGGSKIKTLRPIVKTVEELGENPALRVFELYGQYGTGYCSNTTKNGGGECPGRFRPSKDAHGLDVGEAWKRCSFCWSKWKGRRRLTNQRLIDRFIRESIRCQES